MLVFFDAPGTTTCLRCLHGPPVCRVCGDAMTHERAGQFDRCERCWADLLAAQPALQGEAS